MVADFLPGRWWRWRRQRMRSLFDYPSRDLFCYALTITRSKRERRLAWVRQESALNQHGGNPAIAQYIILCSFHSAIFGAHLGENIALDAGRQRRAGAVFAISFDPMGARPRRGIIMNADKDRVPLRIRDCGPCR